MADALILLADATLFIFLLYLLGKTNEKKPKLDQLLDLSQENSADPRCVACGHLMPEGEAMFLYHGYSGPCPVKRG